MITVTEVTRRMQVEVIAKMGSTSAGHCIATYSYRGVSYSARGSLSSAARKIHRQILDDLDPTRLEPKYKFRA